MAAEDSHDPEKWMSLSPDALEPILRLHERFLLRRPGGRRALLAYHDLSGCDLSGRDLSEAELTGARLRRVNLAAAGLRTAQLSLCDLRQANLDGADLSRADMRGSCFRGAELNKAVLAPASKESMSSPCRAAGSNPTAES